MLSAYEMVLKYVSRKVHGRTALTKEGTELLCIQAHLETTLPEGRMLLLSFEALGLQQGRLKKP